MSEHLETCQQPVSFLECGLYIVTAHLS